MVRCVEVKELSYAELLELSEQIPELVERIERLELRCAMLEAKVTELDSRPRQNYTLTVPDYRYTWTTTTYTP